MQLPDSMKHNQADLYLETYQVLDMGMSHLREIQRWQASAASKVVATECFISSRYLSLLQLLQHLLLSFTPLYHLVQLAADMQRFSRPERLVNGPTITHFWFVLSPGHYCLAFFLRHPLRLHRNIASKLT